MRAMVLVGAAAGLALSQPVVAQSLPPLQLLVEEVPDNQCGLSKPTVESAMRSAARYNRLTLEAEADLKLYAIVDLLPTQLGCAVTINVEIYGFDTAMFGDRQVLIETQFCSQGGTGVLNRNSSQANTLSSNFIKEQVDDCLAQIDSRVI